MYDEKFVGYKKTVSQNWNWYITIYDNAWNASNIWYSVWNIDKHTPTISWVTCTWLDSNNNSSSSVVCSSSLWNTWPSTDTLTYTHSSNDWILPTIWSNLSQTYTYTDNGTYTVGASWKDEANNSVEWTSKTFKIDTSKPSINTSFDFNKWYNNIALSDIVFSVKDQVSSTTDNEEAWLASLEVKVNWQIVSVSWFNQTNNTSAVNVTLSKIDLLAKVTDKANNTIYIKVTDKVWFIQEVTYELDYDNTNPEVLSFNDKNSNWRNVNLTANVTTSDSVSWLNTTRYNIWSDLNSDCSDWATTAPTLSETDWTYIVYVCSKDNAWNITRANQTYKIDKTKPTLSAIDTDNNWKQWPISIALNTSDPLWTSATQKSWLKYSKYNWDSACSSTVWIDYTDWQTISYDTEWRHTLYLCNGDIAWNINTWTSWLYLIDKTNPITTLNSIIDSKKAGKNNININETIFDDKLKADTINLYWENHDVKYELTIKWPYQTWYIWTVINENSVNINESWNIVNNQKLNKTFDLTLAWKYDVAIKLTDKSGRVYNESKTITIYPADLDQTKSNISLDDSVNTKYANNKDTYKYNIVLKDIYWNNIYDKKMTNIEQKWDIKTVDNNNAIITLDDYKYKSSDKDGKTTFKIKSLSPWEYNEIFKLTMNKWWDDYVDNTFPQSIDRWYNINSFKKPFIVELKVSNDDISYNANPEVWNAQKYKFELTNTWKLIWYTDWSIDYGKIKLWVEWHFWEDFKEEKYTFDNNYNTYLWFTARINANKNYLSQPKISWPLYITYDIGWKKVKYLINWSDSAINNDNVSIEWEEQNTLWLRVIWTLQWSQTASEVWQKANFSDISKSELRTQIRKNAYEFTKSMKSWEIVNWVKYVNWDVTLSASSNLWYETLVVKNWNVIITWNLTQSKLWIIVLEDWYNVQDWYNLNWNVFITPNVTKINVVIYTDWWFLSSIDDNKWKLSEDAITRTSKLQKQLVLNWTLFTRNTIGWAIKANNTYTLPGWSKVKDFNQAMYYDLNYIRRWNEWYSEYKWEYDYFVIKYDSTVQSNPPKLFGN